MNPILPLLLASGITVCTTAQENVTLQTAAEVAQALCDPTNENRPFDLRASVLYAHRHVHCSATVLDSTGAVLLFDGTDRCGRLLEENSVARIHGRLCLVPNPPNDKPAFHAVYDRVDPLGSAADELPVVDWKSALFQEPSRDQRVRVKGILRDAFLDEIDPNFSYLTVNDGESDVYAVFSSAEDPRLDIAQLVGDEVTLTGLLSTGPHAAGTTGEGRSRQLNPIVFTHPHDVRATDDSGRDPFAVPDLPPLVTLSASQIARLGRRKIAGTVLTRWRDRNILLKTDDDRIVFASLSDDGLPDCGDAVLVSGVPETAVYYMGLRHAHWRPSTGCSSPTADPIRTVDIRTLFSTSTGQHRFAALFNGTTVRTCGRFIGPSERLDEAHRFYLEKDGYVLPVDGYAISDIIRRIPNDSMVEVTGTCVIRLESGGTLPRISGIFLVVNRASDIVVIRKPSWWTAGRSMSLLAVLLAVLGGVLVWSFILKRLSERRGVELANERIAVVESELKVYERTRLAIELHDMLSQTLSGISMQIDAVRRFFDANREKTIRHLDLAADTLRSCRENLRDCLWDLRSRALEETDLNVAIRETLEPHVGDAALSIRFNVPRDRLSDHTTHAILSIIRELVVNALRHGKAASVKIAGCIENGNLRLSVRDDGVGFDPNRAPGMANGHFGLQGIRERVDGFSGEMTIESSPGAGTEVRIRIALPKAKGEDSPVHD